MLASSGQHALALFGTGAAWPGTATRGTFTGSSFTPFDFSSTGNLGPELLILTVDGVRQTVTVDANIQTVREAVEFLAAAVTGATVARSSIVPPVDSYECGACPSGWVGENCADDVDDCVSNPCDHGTVCTDTGPDSYRCACPANLGGQECQDWDECSSSPCDNAAECYDSLDGTLFNRRINFQPPGTPTPDTYLADEGDLFGSRPGSDLEYGWNCALDVGPSVTIDARRGNDAQRSVRDDTLMIPNRYEEHYNGGSCASPVVWELEVPDGAYEVTVGFAVVDIERGDPRASYTAGCMLEGVPAGIGDTTTTMIEGVWQTSAEHGGTVADTPAGCQCAIPFTYAGTVYDQCITLPSSGTVNLDGTQYDPVAQGSDVPVRYCATINQCGHQSGLFSTRYYDKCVHSDADTGLITRASTNVVHVSDGRLTLQGEYSTNCSALSYIIVGKPGGLAVEEGEYRCVCSFGWLGSNCETRINECTADTHSCDRGLQPVVTQGAEALHRAHRRCDGVQCTRDVTRLHWALWPERSIETLGQSQCTAPEAGRFVCTCLTGFEGNGHECNDIDECASSPCQNGGTCSDSTTDPSVFFVHSYGCACIAGFEGPNCEVDSDECLSNPCKNGAECLESKSQSHCSYLGLGFMPCGTACIPEMVPCTDAYRCSCVMGFANGLCHYDFITEYTNECTVLESVERASLVLASALAQPTATQVLRGTDRADHDPWVSDAWPTWVQVRALAVYHADSEPPFAPAVHRIGVVSHAPDIDGRVRLVWQNNVLSDRLAASGLTRPTPSELADNPWTTTCWTATTWVGTNFFTPIACPWAVWIKVGAAAWYDYKIYVRDGTCSATYQLGSMRLMIVGQLAS